MKTPGIALGSLLLLTILWGVFRLWSDPLERAAPTPMEAGTTATAGAPNLLGESAGDSKRLAAEPAGAEETEPEVAGEQEATEPPEGDACRLRVTLLDAETKAPLAGHRVVLNAVFDRTLEERTMTTDADGVFELAIDPGEYFALHRPEPGDGERALARELTPSRFEAVRTPNGEPCEQVLLARRPPGALEVEVTYADGRPAANALVDFSCRMESHPFVDTGNRTDEAGRVLLGVWDLEDFRDGRLTARDDDGNVSDVLAVEAPFASGVRRLVLAPGGVLEVRVVEADGTPVARRRVLLSSDLPLVPRRYRQTDEEGRMRYSELFSGRYTLSVWLPDRGEWERRQVDMVRGEEKWLEVVLKRPDEPLAVAGVVLDEEERPLANVELAIALDGRRAGTVRTDDAGSFRFLADRCERVWVGANVLEQGDRYEPPEVDVPFGTEYVVFRRTARAVERTFEVEVYDRSTGAELEHFVATIDRGPGTEAWSDSYAPRRKFVLRLLPDARWRVKSHGYLTRELNLSEALDEIGEGERLRVGLDPGLDHAFLVLDADTSQPIAGVLFRSETAGEVRSDAEGRARIQSDHWSVYRATKDGYEPEDWDPDDEVLWASGPFLLVRS